MPDYLKSLGMSLQYQLNKPHEIRGFPIQSSLRKRTFSAPWFTTVDVHVCRQMDYKPAKIPIEVASFIWSFTMDKSQGEHSLFSK